MRTTIIAQLAERQSLAGKLTLSCTRPSANGWPLCGQTVRWRSVNWANSAFHPFGVDKWV